MKSIKFIDEHMETRNKEVLKAAGYHKEDAAFVHCYNDSVEYGLPELTICNMNLLPESIEDAGHFVRACKKYGVDKFMIATHSTADIDAVLKFEIVGAKVGGAMLITFKDEFIGDRDKSSLVLTI